MSRGRVHTGRFFFFFFISAGVRHGYKLIYHPYWVQINFASHCQFSTSHISVLLEEEEVNVYQQIQHEHTAGYIGRIFIY